MEVRKRELEGKFLLAGKAALDGHRVLLGYLHNLLARDLLTPGIFHDKSLTPRPKKLKLMRMAEDSGHAYTSIDEEHGLLRKDYEFFGKARFSEETVRRAAAIFFWGRHDHDFVQHTYPAYRDRLHVTGNPRVDLWRHDMDKIDNPVEVKKPYVLIASNLGAVFGSRPIEEIIQNMRAGYFKGPDDENEFNIYDRFSYSTQLGGHYVRAIRKLALEFPEVTFVLRPHPTEKDEVWKTLIGDYPNVVITKSGSVGAWIKQCEVLIHNGCTTAMEAVKANKAVLTFMPIADENQEFYFANQLGQKCTDLRTLIDGVRTVLEGKDHLGHLSNGRELLAERIADTGDELAADRIVSVWNSLIQPNHSSSTFWKSGRIGFTTRAEELWSEFRALTPGISKMFGAKKTPVLPQKFTPWSQRELNNMKAQFARQFPEFDSLEVTRLGRRLCSVIKR